MQSYAWWENLILGALVLMVVFWMQSGTKLAFQRSKSVPSDWFAVLLPLGFVVLFVVFLIVMV
ncbi:MAG: hypothetical protein NTV00_14460 [Methylococcales bacterium]|nr:hypothetical protein [Methylococcales bacterium]